MGKHDDKEAPAEPKVEATELLTVSQLAEKHGQTQTVHVAGDTPFKSDHLVADVRHGWAHHTHFVGGEVRLTDAEYLAALEAAREGKTHAPAYKRSREHDEAKAKSRAEAKAKAEAEAKKKGR